MRSECEAQQHHDCIGVNDDPIHQAACDCACHRLFDRQWRIESKHPRDEVWKTYRTSLHGSVQPSELLTLAEGLAELAANRATDIQLHRSMQVPFRAPQRLRNVFTAQVIML